MAPRAARSYEKFSFVRYGLGLSLWALTGLGFPASMPFAYDARDARACLALFT